MAYAQRTANASLNVFVKNVDGADEPIQLTDVLNAVPTSWSPDGESIFLTHGAGRIVSSRGRLSEWFRAVSLIDVGAGNSVELLITEPSRSAVLSPDGRWLAYTSEASDRAEVYVSSYPTLERKFLISTDGGAEPRWSGNGRELFYRNGDKMMAVDIHAEAEFSASKPKLLFEGRFAIDPLGGDATNYDVTADGERFVMIREDERARKFHVVVNWYDELNRLVPTDK